MVVHYFLSFLDKYPCIFSIKMIILVRLFHQNGLWLSVIFPLKSRVDHGLFSQYCINVETNGRCKGHSEKAPNSNVAHACLVEEFGGFDSLVGGLEALGFSVVEEVVIAVVAGGSQVVQGRINVVHAPLVIFDPEKDNGHIGHLNDVTCNQRETD